MQAHQIDPTFRTESYDGMEPVGVDPRWEAFKPFHEYLATTFPLVFVYHRLQTRAFVINLNPLHRHSTLTLTKVNSWGLVYVWSGTDGHLKPILLTAHQGMEIRPGIPRLSLDPFRRCRAREYQDR